MGQTVQKVQKNLKMMQDHQKSYDDLKRQHKEFYVGDDVYLLFKPKKSSLRLGSCTKLAPWFCGLF